MSEKERNNYLENNSEVDKLLDGTRTDRMGEGSFVRLRGLFRKRSKRSGNFRSLTSSLSQGCMIVVAVLPIAGLFLGIGSAISNASGSGTTGNIIGKYMSNLGSFVFANLQLLFAVSISIAFSKQSAIAGFTAVVATLVFNGLQSALIIPVSSPENVGKYDVLYWRNVPESVFGNNVGIFSMQSNVFGGIIVATIVAFCYNKFHEIKLPEIINFFGGTRFVPIVASFMMIPVSVLMCMIWPGVGLLFSMIGSGMGKLIANGNVNAFLFGYIERSLVPFGVHHAFYVPLWYSSVGGDMTPHLDSAAYIFHNGNYSGVIGVDGEGDSLLTWKEIFEKILKEKELKSRLVGDQTLWMTINQLCGHTLKLSNVNDPYIITFKTFAQSTFNSPVTYYKNGNSFDLAFPGVDPGQYQQGKFAFMMFGLPAAGAAMILAAPKQNRKFASSIVFSAALTSFLTGITEPIEFTFLFLSPLLFWGAHAFMCAISFWIAALLGANVGMTFSGGAIDYVIYGIVPDTLGHKTNCWILAIIGLVYIPIYFFGFYWWINHFNLNTPGRGGTTKLFTKKDYLKERKNAQKNFIQTSFSEVDIQAYNVLKVIGGLENLVDANACITKLRIRIKNDKLIAVNADQLLKKIGAFGVEIRKGYLMIVFGGKSNLIATSIEKILRNEIDFAALAEFSDKLDSNNQTASEINQQTDSQPSKMISKLTVYSPLTGKIVDLAQTNDISFKNKTLGDGIAIVPSDGNVASPIDGIVKVAFPTGHAYVIGKENIDIMIHIGIDTVNINANLQPGEKLRCFAPKVETGKTVKNGEKIAEVDMNFLTENHYNPITPIIVMKDSMSGYELKPLTEINTNVQIGDPIFEIVQNNV